MRVPLNFEGWIKPVFDLMGTTEFKVGALLALMGILFGVFRKIGGALHGFLTKRSYAAYSSSIAFDQNEVVRSVATYVRQYSMESDPNARYDLAEALSLERQDLFKTVDKFVSKASSKHLFIFADCGMGKTSFLINYFHKKKAWHRRRGRGLVLVSLSRVTSFREIEDVPLANRKSTILLLDAFDEDPLVLEGVAKRLNLLLELAADFRNVVITCRSQFFASDSAIPISTGIPRVGPTKAGESKDYAFNRIYIAPFDSRQIEKYLSISFPGIFNRAKRKRARSLVDRVPSLALRPMLLAHITDVMEHELRESPMSQVDIYQAMASAWVKRESRWVNEKELLLFSRNLAADIFENRAIRGGEFCSRNDVVSLAKLWSTKIRLEYLTGRSLLNRTSEGNCKFAHRSIMEYFVVEHIFSSASGYSLELTDQMQRFLFEKIGIYLPADARLAAESRCKVEVVEPDIRAGYPTNLNLFDVGDQAVNAASVYGIETALLDMSGKVKKLGEHFQSMMSPLDSVGGMSDIRISLERFSRNDTWAIAYLSVWLDDCVVLSKVKVSVVDWLSAMGSSWNERQTTSLVGKMLTPGSRIESVVWRPATRLDSLYGNLDFDFADECPIVSIGFCPKTKASVVRLINAIRETGPLAAFGILCGGSMISVDKRPYIVLNSPARLSGDIGKVIEQEIATSPVAERWPDRTPRRW